MAAADLILLASWGLFALVSCQVTLHLCKDLGIIIASQGFVMTLGALTFTLMVRGGSNYWWGLGATACFGMAVGLSHVPLLRLLGPTLLLVLTAVVHIVLSQFWLALPQLTGGSGGLLLPTTASWWSLVVPILSLAVALAYRAWLLRRPGASFTLASVRTAGEKAGALGVPVTTLYRSAFALYGILLSLCGAEAVRVTGFLTAEMFGLSWAMTVVLITLVASTARSPGWLLAGLAVTFAVTKVGLRQVLQADPQWSHGYDLLAPTLLLLMYLSRSSFLGDARSLKSGSHINE